MTVAKAFVALRAGRRRIRRPLRRSPSSRWRLTSASTRPSSHSSTPHCSGACPVKDAGRFYMLAWRPDGNRHEAVFSH